METQLLADVVGARLPLGSEVGSAELKGLLNEIGLPRDSAEVSHALESSVREWAVGSENLAYSPGGWKVKVSDQLVQSAVTAGLIWAALGAFSISAPLPAILVSAVIPRLFSIERVRLTKTEEEVVAILAISEDARAGTAQELYARLPDEVKEELNYLDFRELLNKVVDAGRAEKSGEQSFELYQPGQKRFRLKFE